MTSIIQVNDAEQCEKRPIGDECVEFSKKIRLDITQESLGDNTQTQPNQEIPLLPPTEEDVGISKYLGTHDGFSGTLKERYSDFLVNEVTLDGDVVRLTELDLPKDENAEGNVDELRSIIGTDIVESLVKLKDGESKERVKINVSVMDKNDRKTIHEGIRKCFPALSSNTEDEGLEKFITVCLPKNDRCRKRSNWPSLRPDFTHFVLYKENKDTMDAINTLAGILRMKPGAFSYAGTKDKRAKSSQIVSVYRVEGHRLLSINNRQRNITIGNIQYKKKTIGLGDLSGNQFVIILRNVNGTEEEISTSVDSLRTLGFINYYGTQRFGTTNIPTHHIGRALISDNWKEAVELILKPREGDEENMAACRRIWWDTRNAAEAFEKLHRKGSIEGQLFESLSKQGNNWVGALDAVPRNTRLLYLHSYQSWIWNQVVSRRIEKYRLSVLVGDLILPSSDKTAKSVPKTVTADDVAENKFSAYDVVLPLPGYQVTYPNNEVAEWYKEILKGDGLDLESFRSKVRSYSLGGSYRKIVVRPDNISWELLHYDDPIQTLVPSDRDVLRGEELPSIDWNCTLFTALKIQLCLPPSCYATVAMRELLKRNVSVWNRNNAH